MRGWGLVIAAGLVAAQTQTDPQAIQRMAATERAFAAAAAEIGVRDAFLTFFADDAVQLAPGATGATATTRPAKDALRARPLDRLPLRSQLIWEPFTGQVSADGSIGWLTGPYADLDLITKDLLAWGAYFSVWKRQADGTWRVWLDEGITLPSRWNDASPFRAAPDPDAGTAGTAGESLQDAEHDVAPGGPAWRARLSNTIRLHREGHAPIVGRDAAAGWAAAEWTSLHYTVIRTEDAGSDDLGVTLGGYDATGAHGSTHGTWVRVWKRDVTGRWRIVFETSQGR
jgi:ketosteroid isomerase-like protein